MTCKKPYRKPEVVRVELRPEEAVLAFCKTTGSSAPGSPTFCSGRCKTSGS